MAGRSLLLDCWSYLIKDITHAHQGRPDRRGDEQHLKYLLHDYYFAIEVTEEKEPKSPR